MPKMPKGPKHTQTRYVIKDNTDHRPFLQSMEGEAVFADTLEEALLMDRVTALETMYRVIKYAFTYLEEDLAIYEVVEEEQKTVSLTLGGKAEI